MFLLDLPVLLVFVVDLVILVEFELDAAPEELDLVALLLRRRRLLVVPVEVPELVLLFIAGAVLVLAGAFLFWDANAVPAASAKIIIEVRIILFIYLLPSFVLEIQTTLLLGETLRLF
jgi:hypothetical protein